MSSSSQKPTISFEFFPPKAGTEEKFWDVVHALVPFSPAFISITCGAGGTVAQNNQTSDLVCQIQEKTPISGAAHLTAIGKTKADITQLAKEYWARGIRHIVALRGDMPNMQGQYTPNPEGYAYASDLIKALKEIAPFEISVAGYPEKHPEALSLEADIENVKRKIEAGGDRILTQFFFDNHAFLSYYEQLQKKNIKAPIVAGILPILDFKKAYNFAKKCGTNVPGTLIDLFNKAEETPTISPFVSAYIAVQQCKSLYAKGITEFHFYSLNSAEILNKVCFLLETMEYQSLDDFIALSHES